MPYSLLPELIAYLVVLDVPVLLGLDLDFDAVVRVVWVNAFVHDVSVDAIAQDPLLLLVLLHFLQILPLFVPFHHFLMVLDLLCTLARVERGTEPLLVPNLVSGIQLIDVAVENFDFGIKMFNEIAKGVFDLISELVNILVLLYDLFYLCPPTFKDVVRLLRRLIRLRQGGLNTAHDLVQSRVLRVYAVNPVWGLAPCNFVQSCSSLDLGSICYVRDGYLVLGSALNEVDKIKIILFAHLNRLVRATTDIISLWQSGVFTLY